MVWLKGELTERPGPGPVWCAEPGKLLQALKLKKATSVERATDTVQSSVFSVFPVYYVFQDLSRESKSRARETQIGWSEGGRCGEYGSGEDCKTSLEDKKLERLEREGACGHSEEATTVRTDVREAAECTTATGPN